MRQISYLSAIVLAALLSACAHGDASNGDDRAVARLQPASGSSAEGTVTFTRLDNGSYRVDAEIRGVSPGPHGFHIHEKGDCSAPDATSAGGHYNPTSDPHGAPWDPRHHVGDFGNLHADNSGVIRAMFTTDSIAFSGERSIIGKAVILHEKRDDLQSQPTGDAGGRIACGVIRR